MAYDSLLVSGTRLYYSLDGSSYTEISDLRSLGAPGMPDAPEVDVTPLADNNGYRAFRLGLATTQQMDVEQFFTKTRMTFWKTYFRSTLLYWRLIYPDNATASLCSKDEFTAWVKTCSRNESTNADEPVTIKVSLKLTGAVSFTAGS